MTSICDFEFKISHFFASYTKLIRFLAWINRFRENCKQSKNEGIKQNNLVVTKKKLNLSLMEIKKAETKLLIYLQSLMFENDERNKFSSFKLFKNIEGLYVLDTKIRNREDSSSFLNPILLDRNHEIVYLLVRETHERLGLVNRVRDFAGPLFLQGGGKCWICIFTCAIYRAVHLELASALSVAGFLECLRRMIARRGRPGVIYSDNGTNFRGTSNAFNELEWEKI